MKIALFIFLLLVAPAQACPPQQPNCPTQRIDDWVAQKMNNEMLAPADSSIMRREVEGGSNLGQADSLKVVSTANYGCVSTSVSGRVDAPCADDPSNPECVGLLKALNNATTCIEFFEPVNLGCKRYGTDGYTTLEWLAVGETFYKSMEGCAAQKNSVDAIVAKSVSLNDKASNLTPDSALTTAEKLAALDRRDAESSDISERRPVPEAGIDDGAAALGYEPGDLVKSAAKGGQSFSALVLASPFAEKLNALHRKELEDGFADSAMVAKRVIENHRLKTSAGEPEPVTVAGPEETASAEAPGENPPEEKNGSVLLPPSSLSVIPIEEKKSAPREARSAAPPATPATPRADRKTTESERIDALADAALLSRRQNIPFRAPSSVAEASQVSATSSADAMIPDKSLFFRVHQTYRRKDWGLGQTGTQAGETIRALAQPEIFNSL